MLSLSKALALAALALASPAGAMNYPEGSRLSLNVVDIRGHENVPAFPGDLVTCEEGDAPGADCNCLGGDEDECVPIAWTSCDTDLDCEIKSRSPWGFKPRRD